MSLYKTLGSQKISNIISDFYNKAFEDILIGHFFTGRDKSELVKKQTNFTISMLGGPKEYTGKSLSEAHKDLNIKPAHFNRRQVLMRETLEDHGIKNVYIDEWLMREDTLRKLIVQLSTACRDLKQQSN